MVETRSQGLVVDLDSILDRMRDAVGAEFVFMLTRRGRLASQHGPPDMPQRGRHEILAATEKALQTGASDGALLHFSLRRDSVVNAGWPGLVDVYVRPMEEALICLLVAPQAKHPDIENAVAAGMMELGAFLAHELEKRARRRGSPGALAHTIRFTQSSKAQPRQESPAPEITLSEATIGRATMAAIAVDADAPEITYGEAALGRETMAEIELSTTTSNPSTTQSKPTRERPARQQTRPYAPPGHSKPAASADEGDMPMSETPLGQRQFKPDPSE